MEFKLGQAFPDEAENAKSHNEARELGSEFPGLKATSVFLSWDFGELMDMSDECVLLSSVLSQQKFEATDIRALAVS